METTQVNMWKHFCTTKETVLSIEAEKPCDWCAVVEKTEAVYQGLYWCFPLQEYKRWPEYMEYYFWLDKKSS